MLIGDRRGADPEAVTEPAPATMKERLDEALRAWGASPLNPRIVAADTPGYDDFLDFVAKRLEGS